MIPDHLIMIPDHLIMIPDHLIMILLSGNHMQL